MYENKHFNRFLLSVFIFSFAALAFMSLGAFGSSLPEDPVRIPILMYHSINNVPIGIPNLSVRADSFDQQMQYLAEHGYTTIYLNEIDSCTPDQKPVIITFDDGYEDNYSCAYPILKKYRSKATVFIITMKLNITGFLSRNEIVQMAELVSFQSHTTDHVRLDRLGPAQIMVECSESKRIIGEMTGKPVYAISYPNGMFNAEVKKIAAAYFDCGVTTLQGTNAQRCDRYRLRRTAVLRSTTLAEFAAKLNG